jgi:hypothetical protein
MVLVVADFLSSFFFVLFDASFVLFKLIDAPVSVDVEFNFMSLPFHKREDGFHENPFSSATRIKFDCDN